MNLQSATILVCLCSSSSAGTAADRSQKHVFVGIEDDANNSNKTAQAKNLKYQRLI